jgi:hypothetical protein
MRAVFGRLLTLVALASGLVAGHPARAGAQQGPPRGLPPVVLDAPTQIESLLATPNVVLVTDYYHVDMRFGPNLRIDAVVVQAVESQTRLRGVRVQVRDNDNRSRQEGTSFLDMDETRRLSRALTSMADLAAKWAGNDDRQATELSFTSAGGFRLAIRQSQRIPRAYLSTGLLDPVVTSIELPELVTLKMAFDQALTILNGK